MNKRFIDFYMDVAKRTAQLSRASRRKVGAIIVKDDKIISLGYNGTPKGWDNECEYKEYMNAAKAGFMSQEAIEERFPNLEYSREVDAYRRYRLVTKDEVLHAERNALDKLAKHDGGASGSLLFTTAAPCIECAKSIYVSGITAVYYAEDYRDNAGLEFLSKSGITVEKLDVQPQV